MAYCVKCGVELEDSAGKCPLCNTKVMLPEKEGQLREESAEESWPAGMDYLNTWHDRKYAAQVLSVLLALPMLVCFLINISYTKDVFSAPQNLWSLYVAGGCALAWVFTVPLLLVQKFRAYIIVGLDAVSIAGFLWLIQWMTGGNWFFSLALPVIAIALLTVWISSALRLHAKLNKLYMLTYIFIMVGVDMFVLEAVIDRYHSADGSISFDWSLFLLASCAVIALLLFVIGRRRKIKEEIRKRLRM